jgi:hypothetical protein
MGGLLDQGWTAACEGYLTMDGLLPLRAALPGIMDGHLAAASEGCFKKEWTLTIDH